MTTQERVEHLWETVQARLAEYEAARATGNRGAVRVANEALMAAEDRYHAAAQRTAGVPAEGAQHG